MEIINNFIKGLNTDLSKTKYQQGYYLDALNFRLTTDVGLSTGNLINVKGNKFTLSIPDTYPVYKILIKDVGTSSITIDGETAPVPIDLTESSTGQVLYDYISTNSTYYTKLDITYKIAINNKYIVIYSKTKDVNVTCTGLSTLVTTEVPAISNLIPIGSTNIRDDIYIFTTNDTSSVGSYGQIWKFNYNKVDYTGTIDLIYNNQLNFTTQHPIPRTACLGRYENSLIQRLYWTDNFNKLRSCNVKDVNLFAQEPVSLNVRPSINYSIPILQKIEQGGNMKVGTYQFSYALKEKGGAISNFSPLSNMVNIVLSSELTATGGNNWHTYVGSPQGQDTGKKINMSIKNVDLNYDRIECYVLIRESFTDIPKIYKFLDEPIPSDGNFIFAYTGNEDKTELTTEEFLNISDSFTHCKTIATKDNRLFVGNVRNEKLDLDWDARAYRFGQVGGIYSGKTLLRDSQGAGYSYSMNSIQSIPEEHDAINQDQYYDVKPNNYGFKYQSNGITLGGEGMNIRYSFGTIAVKTDAQLLPNDDINITVSPLAYAYQDYYYPTINLGIDNQDYNLNGVNDSLKYPYLSGLMKGYHRDEIYRFGILFRDKEGNPMFTKWIGDIKMPSYSDINTDSKFLNGDPTNISDFRLSFTTSFGGRNINDTYLQLLYIKFEINNLNDLKDLISGYEIVRVERKDKDKSILGQGYLLSARIGANNMTKYYPVMVAAGGAYRGEYSYPYNSNSEIKTFNSPDFLHLGAPSVDSASDTMMIHHSYQASVAGHNGPWYHFWKFKNLATFDNTQLPIYTGTSVGPNVELSGTGQNFSNHTDETIGDTNDTGGSSGGIGTTTFIFSTIMSGLAGNYLYLSNYYRKNNSRYGGYTYSQRSTNEYISCQNFQPFIDGTYSYENKVFGGDIFVTQYDNQYIKKNWGIEGRPSAAEKYSKTYYFPVESTVNTYLRNGIHMNKDFNNLDNGSGSSGYETYDYNRVYSNENNIKKYFPKPVDFEEVEEFDNRVYYSDIKINGETQDSWSIFKTNDYYDVEGSYGGINALDILNDKAYFFQNNATGLLQINPTSVVVDTSGTETLLGKGDVIQRHNYISTNVGCRHQHSIVKSNSAFYFPDINSKKWYKLSNGLEPISDIKGMHGFLQKNLNGSVINLDNPIHNFGGTDGVGGITGTYDYENNEAIFTVFDKFNNTQNNYTIAINESIDNFTTRYSYTPSLYVTDNSNFFSFDPSNLSDIYMHNKGNYGEFYGVLYDSYIEILVNPNPQITKVFDNFVLQTEVQINEVDTASGGTPVQETFNKYRVFNDYQDSTEVTLIPETNIFRKLREWTTIVPRDSNTPDYVSPTLKARIRDKYMTAEFWFTNNNNKRFIVHDIKTRFR